jgi:hypothetical protein
MRTNTPQKWMRCGAWLDHINSQTTTLAGYGQEFVTIFPELFFVRRRVGHWWMTRRAQPISTLTGVLG